MWHMYSLHQDGVSCSATITCVTSWNVKVTHRVLRCTISAHILDQTVIFLFSEESKSTLTHQDIMSGLTPIFLHRCQGHKSFYMQAFLSGLQFFYALKNFK